MMGCPQMNEFYNLIWLHQLGRFVKNKLFNL